MVYLLRTSESKNRNIVPFIEENTRQGNTLDGPANLIVKTDKSFKDKTKRNIGNRNIHQETKQLENIFNEFTKDVYKEVTRFENTIGRFFDMEKLSDLEHNSWYLLDESNKGKIYLDTFRIKDYCEIQKLYYEKGTIYNEEMYSNEGLFKILYEYLTVILQLKEIKTEDLNLEVLSDFGKIQLKYSSVLNVDVLSALKNEINCHVVRLWELVEELKDSNIGGVENIVEKWNKKYEALLWENIKSEIRENSDKIKRYNCEGLEKQDTEEGISGDDSSRFFYSENEINSRDADKNVLTMFEPSQNETQKLYALDEITTDKPFLNQTKMGCISLEQGDALTLFFLCIVLMFILGICISFLKKILRKKNPKIYVRK